MQLSPDEFDLVFAGRNSRDRVFTVFVGIAAARPFDEFAARLMDTGHRPFDRVFAGVGDGAADFGAFLHFGVDARFAVAGVEQKPIRFVEGRLVVVVLAHVVELEAAFESTAFAGELDHVFTGGEAGDRVFAVFIRLRATRAFFVFFFEASGSVGADLNPMNRDPTGIWSPCR